jgi:hypothetical protein
MLVDLAITNTAISTIQLISVFEGSARLRAELLVVQQQEDVSATTIFVGQTIHIVITLFLTTLAAAVSWPKLLRPSAAEADALPVKLLPSASRKAL